MKINKRKSLKQALIILSAIFSLYCVSFPCIALLFLVLVGRNDQDHRRNDNRRQYEQKYPSSGLECSEKLRVRFFDGRTGST